MTASMAGEAAGFYRDAAIAGAACVLDGAGALYLPDWRALVVADLHLEKASALARRGAFLPPYDTCTTLAALATVIRRYAPGQVIALGDSFHDGDGPGRLAPADRAALSRLQAGRDWIWITGNHDPELPAAIGGGIAAEVRLGALTLRHEPAVGAKAEIAGHLHPVGRVVRHGRGVRRRAFVTDGGRCVVPAFGAYAGGLNACDPAFAPLFPRGFTAHLIGSGRLFAIPEHLLSGD